MDNFQRNLASDFLRCARNFIFLADQACKAIKPNTVERVMIVEGPLTFLISHAAELVLKASLAEKNYSEEKLAGRKFGHDLMALANACNREKIILDDRFMWWVETVAENHKNFDYRYERTFSGFPPEEYDRLMNLIRIERTPQQNKELRKHGLAAKSRIDAEGFIAGVQKQIQIASEQMHYVEQTNMDKTFA